MTTPKKKRWWCSQCGRELFSWNSRVGNCLHTGKPFRALRAKPRKRGAKR